MSVYVGPLIPCLSNLRWRYRESCHLFADTLAELHAFAARLGLRRLWYQRGKRLPHYDLTKGKRLQALGMGATGMDRREAVTKWREIEGWRERVASQC